MGTTLNYALRYPEANEAANVPADMQELATDVDTVVHDQVTPLDSRVTNLESQVNAIAVAEAGDLKLSARSAPSAGWLLCDGTAVSRTTYSVLFAAIGIDYGPGDGSTTFNLPDYRGRTPVGVGVHADVSARGANEGALAANRRPRHRHTVNDPSHGHPAPFYRDQVGPGTTTSGTGNNQFSQIPYAYTGITVGPQSGAEPVDSAGYQTCNVFIKT